MAYIPLLPTTHGEIRNSLNTMLSNDIYREDHLVWFDVAAAANGGGSINDPFNVWANLLARVGASPSEQFTILFMPQTVNDYVPANNISVTGIGAGAHNIITNAVTYINALGFNGSLSELTFSAKSVYTSTDDALMLVSSVAFNGGFDIATNLVAGVGGIRGTNTIFAGSGGTKFACPIINLAGCLFDQTNSSITLIDNTGATGPDVIVAELSGCTFNNEFRVVADTGIVNIIFLNSLVLTNTMLFNTTGGGVINLTVDETTYTQMQGIGVDFSTVNLTVLSQNGGTGFVPFYHFSDVSLDTASTSVIADNPTTPTNWVSTKAWTFNVNPDPIPVIGQYELTVTFSWSMDTTTREAFYRVLIDGSAVLPEFYRKEAKDADDRELVSFTIPYTHVTNNAIVVNLQFLIESGSAVLTTEFAQFIVERKQ